MPNARSVALVLAAASLATAGCAPAPYQSLEAGASAARPCLYPDRIVNFRSDADQRLYVRTQGDGVFALTGSNCFDLDGALAVGIRPTFGGFSRLCPGDEAEIVLPARSFGPNPCRARLDRRLSEAEVEALPSRSRP